jgi:ABC-type bacteriocin/lantibiotic exporter with double-glycine peptidase domain
MRYFRQAKDYTSGPAVMRTVLKYFDMNFSEGYLIRILGTTKSSGTRILRMVSTFRRFGMTCKLCKNSNLRMIKDKYKKNFIIVNYYLEDYDEGHFAIVRKVTKNKIYLMDPWYGPKDYDVKYFSEQWHNRSNTLKKAMVCVKK